MKVLRKSQRHAEKIPTELAANIQKQGESPFSECCFWQQISKRKFEYRKEIWWCKIGQCQNTFNLGKRKSLHIKCCCGCYSETFQILQKQSWTSRIVFFSDVTHVTNIATDPPHWLGRNSIVEHFFLIPKQICIKM